MQDFITRAVPTGVYVVTVRKGDIINGMTAAWVTQVSFKPPLIAVAVAPPRFTHDLIKDSGYFCINTIPEDGKKIAKHFGFKSGRKTDKFKGYTYTNALKGSPVLEQACAYIECELQSTCEAGDHTLFIGSIVDHALLKEDTDPLIFKWNDFFGKKG